LRAGEMDLQVILGSFVIWPLEGRIVAQKSEKLTCFCPKYRPQIQHSTTTMGQCEGI
jgi:hypothetical protein